MNDYLKQANDFLEKTGAKIEIAFSHSGKYFDDDKEIRDVYIVKITKGQRKYCFKFGNSLNNSGFYFTIGRQRYELYRKHIDSKNLISMCKKINYEFSPQCKSDIIHKPIKPTNYDILACLTKYNPGTFENFCSDFGYDTDSKKAEKTYNAVKDEWLNISRIFNDSELQELREIS
jgi:hypothetical protein